MAFYVDDKVANGNDEYVRIPKQIPKTFESKPK